jgi:hypothetical protein
MLNAAKGEVVVSSSERFSGEPGTGGRTVEVGDVDGHRISRSVSAELIGVWRDGWGTAARMQEENPALRAIALQSPPDPDAAMDALIPVLAYTHPRFQATVISVLDLAIAELDDAARERVTGGWLDPDVETERVEEASEQQDRLAQLQRQADRIEAKLERISSLLGERGSRRPETPGGLDVA